MSGPAARRHDPHRRTGAGALSSWPPFAHKLRVVDVGLGNCRRRQQVHRVAVEHLDAAVMVGRAGAERLAGDRALQIVQTPLHVQRPCGCDMAASSRSSRIFCVRERRAVDADQEDVARFADLLELAGAASARSARPAASPRRFACRSRRDRAWRSTIVCAIEVAFSVATRSAARST